MFSDIAALFKTNARDVERLIDFDRDVIDVMIMSLDSLKKDVPSKEHVLRGRIDRVSSIITGIRNNESLKSKYGVVCNQAVVLLVSHFASALGDMFRKAVSDSLDRDDSKSLLDEELKLTFRDMKERSWNLKESAADLLIAKKDLTFQDMQSTVRAFDTYVNIQIEKDQRTNNIILGQAARHVIVHSSGRVTGRMIKQVSRADPRTLKPSLTLDELLIFAKEEVLELKSEMVDYVEALASKLASQE
ncbi:hypothetical protein [Methylibium petroleiphilum]|uniref:hypothetical protein n=1 Tax=Methylibium petroleiphilum TaxID=105560 RepID=UPI001AC93A63|nr:hypothetical protein [Methylibium petroleiphilum]MBN9204156.1 hypothetical protein [Methylibium petroleiphilum]